MPPPQAEKGNRPAMGTTPINLRQARKARARAQKRREADANAARFGRTPAERARDEGARTRAERMLDQHHRERVGAQPPPEASGDAARRHGGSAATAGTGPDTAAATEGAETRKTQALAGAQPEHHPEHRPGGCRPPRP